jgi:hypothetical protein
MISAVPITESSRESQNINEPAANKAARIIELLRGDVKLNEFIILQSQRTRSVGEFSEGDPLAIDPGNSSIAECK